MKRTTQLFCSHLMTKSWRFLVSLFCPPLFHVTQHYYLVAQNAAHYTRRLIQNFQAQLANVMRGHAEIALHFPDYLGSFTSMYLGHRLTEPEVSFISLPRPHLANTHHRTRSSKFE